MDQSLHALCNTVKKVFNQLKPNQNALSFLILTGKDHQGKTTLLQQSPLTHITVHTERQAEVYYNEHGVIVELGESWLNQNKNPLEYTLKQLNRCHRHARIGGLILCVNISELLTSDPNERAQRCKAHAQLMHRFGHSLGYAVEVIVLFTKLDLLAGFCDFFQYEHASELQKPFGFSIQTMPEATRWMDAFKAQFDPFIEALNEQIIQKIHPARSSLKRTLIREFPLQLAGLGQAIQHLLCHLVPQPLRLDALYFTSAEQGGLSVDRLNKKIKQEYALEVQDQFSQSINYRAYFIEGALHAFQQKTKRPIHTRTLLSQWPHRLITSLGMLGCLSIVYQHQHMTSSLHHARQEWATYTTLKEQKNTAATYHLSNASTVLNQISRHTWGFSTLEQLKTKLHLKTQQQLTQTILPKLKNALEHTLNDPKASPTERYQALKMYVMLHQPEHFSEKELLSWLQQHQTHITPSQQQALFQRVFVKPFSPLPIHQQYVRDARNYLNALPLTYFYYALAKTSFSNQTQRLNLPGFGLTSQTLPVYFTKAGFQETLKSLPGIAQQLQAENWVLERQDLTHLTTLLEQAYTEDYVLWWQQLIHHSLPTPAKTYTEARQLTETLRESMPAFVLLIQQHTAPERDHDHDLFNRDIASKFTDINLISPSSIRALTRTLVELEKFINTLSLVNDQGQTAFNLAKVRFQGDHVNNPLRALYTQVKRLPHPVSTWAQHLADDTWVVLLHDGRTYLNEQWKTKVYQTYETTIAHRYPFDVNQTQEISMTDFNHFFAPHGQLNRFIDENLKPFLNTSNAQWTLKHVNHYVLPIKPEMLNELIRANVITHMFFPDQREESLIKFSLQKISLDPVVSTLRFTTGDQSLSDTQTSESFTQFQWPSENAKLKLHSIEGHHYTLEETGPWALFKLFHNINVLVDEEHPGNIHLLFEINGNSGRYLLKTQNEVNPFIPGVLTGFELTEALSPSS